jgi:hypothetical protein
VTARFAKVPLGLLDWWASARLTASESAVLVYLLRQTAGEMRDTTDRWAGAAMIRQATGLADASISRALVSLRARRVIEVVRSHGIDTATVYRLTPPPERTPSPQRWGDPPLSRGGTLPPHVGGPLPSAVGGPSPQPWGDRSEVSQREDQNSATQHRARGLASDGPPAPRVETPAYDGDVSAVVAELARSMTRPDRDGVVRRPTAMQEQALAMAIIEAGEERVRALAADCARQGWGIAGLLRCFDEGGRVVEAKVPGAKVEAAPANEPEWARLKRVKAEAAAAEKLLRDTIRARPGGDESMTQAEDDEIQRLRAIQRSKV